MSKAAFIQLVTADQPEAPAYFAYDAMLNRRERPTLEQTLERTLTPLTLDGVLRQMNAGAQVVDVREWQEKHIEGSCNMPLNHLAERLTDVPHDREVVVHCASGYRSSIAASLLERHGFTQVADLVGGFAAWEASQFATIASA
jgi:rhodanese-related sulfurtransferase